MRETRLRWRWNFDLDWEEEMVYPRDLVEVWNLDRQYFVDWMQYIWRKDKNWKDIYFWDIIQFSDKWERYRWWHIFCDESTYKEILENHEKYPYERRVIKSIEDYEWLLSSEIQQYWEIIGNIFENPNLINNNTNNENMYKM